MPLNKETKPNQEKTLSKKFCKSESFIYFHYSSCYQILQQKFYDYLKFCFYRFLKICSIFMIWDLQKPLNSIKIKETRKWGKPFLEDGVLCI